MRDVGSKATYDQPNSRMVKSKLKRAKSTGRAHSGDRIVDIS